MAEVVTGAMGTLLPKLADLLTQEYRLHKGVRGEIMFLKAEMESMQTALLKVSEAPIDQPPDIQVKLWAKAVRELSYDLEDNIDKFMVHVDTHGTDNSYSFMGFINRSLNLMKKARIRRKIGVEIKDIKNRMKEVSERRDRNQVDIVAARPTRRTTDSLRQIALHRRAKELIIGTEDKSSELVNMLREMDKVSKEKLKIVSIVGFGGLGKTTLANVVYQKLKVEFDHAAFVSVSFSPNIEKIFKNLLHQLDNVKYANINESMWDEAQLIGEIREFLRNKRYLIFIDDIWDISVWKNIKCALIENECGSRAIVTTRILDVAEEVGGVYQLKPLSTVDSRKLFYQTIYGTEDQCPLKYLAEVSENILKKCGGVPLAIITIASMLLGKNGTEHWSKVYQSMGSGLQDNPGVDDMRRILYVSYYDLPPYLKTCLLYLSLYPEDYEILKKDLIWKWIGEGFIQKKQGMSLYEVGEKYIDELINKSLIQPVSINGNNDAKFCCVHDMVLDLITFLSREENFLTTFGGQQHESVPRKIRRLSLHASKEEDVKQLSTVSLSHVRSLTVFKKAFYLLPTLSRFPLLSALDLSGCKQVDDRHSKFICNMFHLRYLWLYGTYITEIPKEIGNLQFLQVLDICETEIEELPSTFFQLRQLVYLRFNHWIRLSSQIKNLKSLQEFQSVIVMSPSEMHDLSWLTELRCLDMEFFEWNKSFEKTFLHCLSNLVNLQTLKLWGCNLRLDSGCESLLPGPQQLRYIKMEYSKISLVPKWMASLSSLSSLAITLYTLGAGDLQLLGSLPSLSYLKIRVHRGTRHRHEWLAIDHGCPFRCLKEFIYVGNTEVVFARGGMQNLQTLYVRLKAPEPMHQVGYYDLGMEYLSSLEQVTISFSCEKDDPKEVDVAEAAFRKALDLNTKRPTVKLLVMIRRHYDDE